MVEWPDRRTLLSLRHLTAPFEFGKRHLQDSQTIDLFGLNAKRHVWRKPGTIPTVMHGGGSIMLWGCFSVAGTGKLTRIEEKLNGEKYREILYENMLQSVQELTLSQRFTFQQYNDPFCYVIMLYYDVMMVYCDVMMGYCDVIVGYCDVIVGYCDVIMGYCL